MDVGKVETDGGVDGADETLGAGETLGEVVGKIDGVNVGDIVGETDGVFVGKVDGVIDGRSVG